MALSIIGVGYGRTGTMSLKLALEELGYGPCHLMEDVFKNPPQVPTWRAAIAGEPVDWDQVYDGYSATTDWPGAGFSKELADHFPDAKIILTARHVDSWWESYSNTIMKYLVELPDEGLPPHIDAMARSVIQMLSNKLGAVLDNYLRFAILIHCLSCFKSCFGDPSLKRHSHSFRNR
jgi:hypothetical protein